MKTWLGFWPLWLHLALSEKYSSDQLLFFMQWNKTNLRQKQEVPEKRVVQMRFLDCSGIWTNVTKAKLQNNSPTYVTQEHTEKWSYSTEGHNRERLRYDHLLNVHVQGIFNNDCSRKEILKQPITHWGKQIISASKLPIMNILIGESVGKLL